MLNTEKLPSATEKIAEKKLDIIEEATNGFTAIKCENNRLFEHQIVPCLSLIVIQIKLILRIL